MGRFFCYWPGLQQRHGYLFIQLSCPTVVAHISSQHTWQESMNVYFFNPTQLVIVSFFFHSTVFPIPSYYSYSFKYSSLSSRQSGECDCRRGCFSFQVIIQGLPRKYQIGNPFFPQVISPLLTFWAGTSGCTNKAGYGKAQNGWQSRLCGTL